ncbi:MAG TPA: MmgE/PrpD family protein, partial [Chakrabartia sp.]|nr:MmgE/PrpD family protein [Chakrabartia sp.]
MTSLDPTPALSRHLATHIAALNYAALPPKVEQMTRRALLDALGVMLGASGLAAEAQPFHALALASPGPARLLAGGTAAPGGAGPANGGLAPSPGFGDGFDYGPPHPHA